MGYHFLHDCEMKHENERLGSGEKQFKMGKEIASLFVRRTRSGLK